MVEVADFNKKKARLVELDAVRGLACIAVILFHYTYHYEENWGHSSPPIFLFEYGKYGVELFFMLSGFVIFMSLQNKDIKRFLVLRFWRLFPAYWVAVLAIFIISEIIPLSPEILVHGNISFGELLVNFTMIPTVFSLRYVDSSHWTLGYELLFYLHIAIIFSLCKAKENVVMYVLLFWTILSIFWYEAIKNVDIYSWMTVWWQEDMSRWQYSVSKLFLFPYIGLFLIGISVYLLYQNRRTKTAYCGILIGLISNYYIWERQHFLCVLFVVAIFLITVFIKPVFLRSKPLVFFGTISYSLYLIHQNIGFRIIKITENLGVNSNFSILIAMLIVIALSIPLHFYVERAVYKRMRKNVLNRS